MNAVNQNFKDIGINKLEKGEADNYYLKIASGTESANQINKKLNRTDTSSATVRGLVITGDTFQVAGSSQPAVMASPGAFGDVRIGTINGVWYLFVSTGANIWGRIQLSGW
ncbi:MAG: hypothetical protein KKD77_20320 [Gammaproteobacteria bacterium]|nr:hypothetical protein [Gammaproteobacteria bacterium]